ncbi:putative carboxylesterase 13 [Raphanus sativus]|uniref:Probable carboxylesterase 12 n=1 Tax=Raphanus sativus TaxID=3726 RepID=A0A6J0LYW0_RAPSA|nr:probable carboxylesterase 12 [Raphanus sativus]KAJ4910495.1 putative carboxylesterase 13 [Raphanus sativus]
MDSEIAFDFSPVFIIYKSGRIERLTGETIVPPSLTPHNGVVSKDVVYCPGDNLSVRVFLPEKAAVTDEKLPLLIYFHGGGFIIETAFSPTYHTFLTTAVSASNCIAVSVDYLRPPEHPIPIPYENSWTSLKWVFTHIDGRGQENWLNEHADFSKVFLAGDSAGGNITHHMTMRAAKEKLSPELSGSGISGIILVHPYFWSKTPVDDKETRDVTKRSRSEVLWEIASPNSKDGVDDPWINVVQSGSVDISGLGCGKVLVMVAELDVLVRQDWCYAAKLERSGRMGEVEVMETEGESHVFHLRNPDTEKAHQLVKKFASFIKGV